LIAHTSVAIGVIYVLTTVILLCFFCILAVKSRAVWVQKRTEKVLSRFQHYFAYVQSHLEDEERLKTPHVHLTRFERRVLQKKLIELIECVNGSHRQKLIALCTDLDLIKLDLHRLHSPFHWVRIDAAYNLGAMRCEQAVPRLLRLLDSKKYDPTMFVIARSIAKCSRDMEDLEKMLQLLVKHRKKFYQLVADVIQESEMDTTALLVKLLKEEDRDLIKIALTALPVYVAPTIAPLLYPLIDSDDNEIRMAAVKLLHSDRVEEMRNDVSSSEIDRLLQYNHQVQTHQKSVEKKRFIHAV